MESWRMIFREGFAPVISTAGLQALLAACESDDKTLVQGVTTDPSPLMCTADWPVEAADPVAFCGWKGDGMTTVSAVSEYFSRTCFECDRLLGEAAACRHVLNWIDDSPREDMLRELAAECRLELSRRADEQGKTS